MGLTPLVFPSTHPCIKTRLPSSQSADCEPPCWHWANPDTALASEPLEEESEADEIDNPQ